MSRRIRADIIGLDKDYAKKLSEKFNVYLANLHVVYVKLHNFHWNVVGPEFVEFHELTEELYNEVAAEIDEIAERIRMLGYFPLASMKEYLHYATLTEAKSAPYDTQEIAAAILDDFASTARFLREVNELADGQNDEHTNSILEEALAFLEKYVWFFSAYIKKLDVK